MIKASKKACSVNKHRKHTKHSECSPKRRGTGKVKHACHQGKTRRRRPVHKVTKVVKVTPYVNVNSPEVNLTTPPPTVNVSTPTPEVNVTTPPPTVNVEAPNPEIHVSTSPPIVNVTTPAPEVTVRTPAPIVNVTVPEDASIRGLRSQLRRFVGEEIEVFNAGGAGAGGEPPSRIGILETVRKGTITIRPTTDNSPEQIIVFSIAQLIGFRPIVTVPTA
ncbi:hypothetical protein [Paenibacillus hexagrammi]|uniref:Uncharacterized protein n=1 Tax=Paenibacillus hexagrammi TaxID=2908839 RepID=A0ABY3SRA0_9BACL|nr:hypothetical protein [Paenibacillus sp. YPD9-1]UJF35784.1 hypothetical protein L0M14_12270 [Paenibacillus sp. YPD9-1]